MLLRIDIVIWTGNIFFGSVNLFAELWFESYIGVLNWSVMLDAYNFLILNDFILQIVICILGFIFLCVFYDFYGDL